MRVWRQNLEYGRPAGMLLGRVALQVPRPEHLLWAERTRPLHVRLARVEGGEQLVAEAPGGLAARAHQQPQAGLNVETARQWSHRKSIAAPLRRPFISN